MNPIEIKNIIEKKFSSSVLEFKEDVKQPFLVVEKSKIRDIAEFLKNDASLKFDFLKSLAGVDLKDKYEIVYHLYSYSKNHEAVLKVRLTKEDPKIDSVFSVWGVANWFERETYDLLGIHFEGHPDLRRIMLPDDWVGHPLRKDYKEPEEYRGISHKR